MDDNFLGKRLIFDRDHRKTYQLTETNLFESKLPKGTIILRAEAGSHATPPPQDGYTMALVIDRMDTIIDVLLPQPKK